MRICECMRMLRIRKLYLRHSHIICRFASYIRMKKKTRNKIIWIVLAAMVIFTMVLWTIGVAFMQ